MNFPAEFSNRIYKTRIGFSDIQSKKLSQIIKDFPGSEIDVIYDNLKPIIVIVFETPEDCLAFTLTHGDKYV